MKVVNLEKVSKIKRANLIFEYCGGAYSRKEAMQLGGVGIGGLKYIEGATEVDKIKRRSFLRSNIETFKEGIGFYLRDEEGNYMLIIHNSEILNITFYKESDEIIDRASFSFFKSCMDRGIPYHYSKFMLMEDEIVNLHVPKLKVITTSLDEINFECTRKNPLKIREYFEASPIQQKFNSDYNTFKVT